jgi:hypothetical protein
LISTPWRLVRKDSRTLFVLVASGGCIRFDHVAADEREEEVTLTALSERITRKGASSCTGELQLEVVAACLDDPLGDRKLRHAPISEDWPGKDTVDSTPPGLAEPQPCD